MSLSLEGVLADGVRVEERNVDGAGRARAQVVVVGARVGRRVEVQREGLAVLPPKQSSCRGGKK